MEMISITRTCPFCGTPTTVNCRESEWLAYENGALAQDAFPEMDLHTRETLISGMCPDCQSKFFDIEDDWDCDGDCDECEEWADCPSRDLGTLGCSGECSECEGCPIPSVT